MKELSIEEKAKRYDEALIRANKMVKDMTNIGGVARVDDIQYLFPELKESEDERIRKALIKFFTLSDDNADYQCCGVYCKDIVDWLEKQGGHAKFLDSIQVGDKVTRNQDGVLVNLSQLKRVAKKDEKQGGQKPADKVEPKFHKGDYVVYCNEDVDLITGIEENGYTINEGGYIPFVCASDIRLWTVQDAKDGDVLQLGMCTVIFKKLLDLNAWCYCSYTEKDGFDAVTDNDHIYGTGNASPATKEQCDLLFAKMKEEGYEWDAEKKELRKIEQDYAWGEEDEKKFSDILAILRGGENCYYNSSTLIDWLKSIRPQKQWKPSDEQLHYLSWIANVKLGDSVVEQEVSKHLNELYEDLKKLREV